VGFRVPKTVLWWPKVQFSEQTFVLKSPPIANLQNVIGNPYKTKIKPLTKFEVQRFELKETI